jgi:hypothetical protein
MPPRITSKIAAARLMASFIALASRTSKRALESIPPVLFLQRSSPRMVLM